MKTLFLILSLCFSLLAIETPKHLMESISKHAITIGNGPEDTYIFVDPMCPRSKSYISLINGRTDLHKKKSYHIFLYRLHKFESDKLIQYIYQSENTKLAFEDVMVNNKELDINNFEPKKDTLNKIEEIAVVAAQMKMKRRPYQISFERKTNFCTVSEGKAACMEEESF